MLRRGLRQVLRHEQGSMSVELVLIAPALVLVILLLVAGARLALAGNSVESAAAAAARDASLSRTASAAQLNATQAAQTSIAQAGLSCASFTVVIDDSGLSVPLGEVGLVSATLSCTLDLTDIALPGLPGTKTMTTTATSPVDAYRER
ncbi:pilus assembly protein [Cryobacterium melibiosiphilum]|uniref:Pilus assembly protein n=2 Tax=Cryobacterium melibiosiphilum TaxID=995039 RepID=A0A3A5M9E3_9MICO|nr:pilus assembly protein [Cryobacterium melibiosiphilum]